MPFHEPASHAHALGTSRFLSAKNKPVDRPCRLAGLRRQREPGCCFVSSPFQFPLELDWPLPERDLSAGARIVGPRIRWRAGCAPMAWRGLKRINPSLDALNTYDPAREVWWDDFLWPGCELIALLRNLRTHRRPCLSKVERRWCRSSASALTAFLRLSGFGCSFAGHPTAFPWDGALDNEFTGLETP